MKKIWFEVRLLWVFLIEVVAHPFVTSTIIADRKTGKIIIERK